ncbi:hypothetical protein AD998_20550 [bacterium 336/3]|nr:hypothetical protein AD998_20550 [bacterium 336/3]
MNNIYSLIDRTSKKTFIFILVVLLVVFNILMNTPGLPTSTPSMQKISPTFTPFDLQAKGYNVESFTSDLDKLGTKGRSFYKNFMLCDIFFPTIYALTFSSLIFLVFHNRKNWLKWLFLIPLLTGFADYIENIFITISFSRYPSSDHLAVTLASIATQTKMLFNALLILSLLLTLGTWIATLFKKK